MDTELIGINEVAAILGMKPNTIRYKYAYKPDFPKAVQYVTRGKRCWKREEVIAYRDMKQARAA